MQGVGFRAYVEQVARNMQIKGFARNLDNGNVEVIVEGEIDNVDKMHEICRVGAKHSVVKDVELTEISFQDFQEFKILHI